jgi:hypothetical protein
VIADADLPVWTIKPNWANGIRETLSWLTDVLASTYGPEQRRALRLSPRREFEMTFNPIDAVRSYFDLWLHRMGSFEFMVPLFHDSGRLTTAIVAGAVTIPFDTTYREFDVGDLAIILGDDPFTFDKVAITAVDPDGITVAAGGVTRVWPKRTRIHPLRRSRISDESQASALTNHVGEATLQFQLNQANDLPDEGAWATLYGDYPIIVDPPNRRENLDLTFNRNSLLLDNDLGLRVLSDDAGRAFTVQVDSRMMVGRAEHWAFRQMLYRLRGQQGTVWLPSFNRDIELSQDRLAADAYLNVNKIGYGYTGGVIDGRQHLLIDGTYPVKVTGVGVEPSPAEERLNLLAAAGAPLSAGTFGSFMDTCRLASDDIEIMHYTDTDGAAECNLNFKSFRDPRIVPDPISFPIPSTEMSADNCGTPAAEEAACVFLPATFDGWYYKVWVDIFNINDGGEVRNDGFYNLDQDGAAVGWTGSSNVEWISGRFGELTEYGIHTGAIWTIDVEGGFRPLSWHLQEQHGILVRPAGNGLYNIPGLQYNVYIRHWTETSWFLAASHAIGGVAPHENYWEY